MNGLHITSPICQQQTAVGCRLLAICYSLVTCLALTLPQAGLAQEEIPDGSSPVSTVETTIPEERYEHVFVPEQDLGQVWSIKSGILLNKPEFLRLLEQAEQASTELPQGFQVESVRYTARLQGDLLEMEARCKISKQAPGWAQLVIPLQNVALKQATLNGKPAPLGLMEDPSRLILLDHFVGSQELLLQLTTPVHRVGTDELASFVVFPQAPATLQMQVAAGRRLLLGAEKTEAETTAPEAREVQLPVGNLNLISLRITDAVGESVEQSLVFAMTEYAGEVARESVRWQANCLITSFGKRFQQLEFSVPSQLELTDVQAAGLQSWELQEDSGNPGWTRLVVNFREAIPERLVVTLKGIQLLADQPQWQFASLKLHGVMTHTGRLALGVAEDLRLKTEVMAGIRPTLDNWKPVATFLHHRPLQHYEIREENFVFQLALAELLREVQAAVSHVLVVEETNLQLSSVITLQTLFAPLFELNVAIPAQWQPKKIQVDQQQIDWQYVSRSEEETWLRIPLTPPLNPGEKRTLAVLLQRAGESTTLQEQPQQFPLPDIKLDEVKILQGTYAVTAPELLEVDISRIEGMDPVLLGMPGERLGFQYQDSIIAGQVQVVRRPARFSASSQQLLSVDERQLHLHLKTLLHAEGGGLRQVTVLWNRVPELPVEFESLSPVKIIQQEREKTEQGLQWKLTFDRYVTGEIPLQLQASFPRDPEHQLAIPELVYPQAELQEQFLLFAAEPEQRLLLSLADLSGQTLAPLDPANLPELPAPGRTRTVAGFRLVRPGVTGTLQVENYTPQPVPAAIGTGLELTTLLQESGTRQQQATLKFDAVGIQSLLITLPEQAQLWSTTVDGKPVVARQGKSGFLVSLPETGNKTTSHTLTAIYGLPEERLALQSGKQFRLPAPEFLVQDGQGSFQKLDLLQTDWMLLHRPDSFIQTRAAGVQTISAPVPNSPLVRLLNYIQQKRGLPAIMVYLILGSFLAGVAALVFAVVAASVPDYRSWKIRPWLWWLGVPVVTMGFLFFCCAGLLFIGSLPRATQQPQWEQIVDRSIEQAVPQVTTAPTAAPIPDDLSVRDTDSLERSEMTADQNSNGVLELQVEMPKAPTDFRRRGNTQSRPNFGTGQRNFQSPQEQLGRHTPANASEEFNPLGTSNIPEQQAPALTTPPPAVTETAKTAETGKQPPKHTGLLSLAISLEHPDSVVTTHLRALHQESTGIAVTYYSEQLMFRLAWLLAAIMVLAFWLLRESSATQKLLMFLFIPWLCLAAIGVLPIFWFPVLEGILIGYFLGIWLWLFLLAWRWLASCGWCSRLTGSQRRVIATMLLCGCFFPWPSAPSFAEDKPAAEGSPKVRLVFPYAKGESPLAADRVFVPQAEYLRLWKLAHPETTAPELPVGSLIHDAAYVAEFQPATAENNQPWVVLKARYVIQNYRQTPVQVSLPVKSLLMDSQSINGAPVAATLGKFREPAVLLTEPGVSVVDVQYRLPVDALGTSGQFTIPLTPVASGSLSFRYPAEELQLRINEGKTPFQKLTREGISYAEIAISAGGPLVLAWQPRVETGHTQQISCQSSREVFLKAQGAELQYVFQVQTSQGSFSELEFQLPEAVKLKTLQGEDLSGWQVGEDNRLRVLMKKPVENQTRIVMLLYAPLSISEQTSAFVLPDVVPLGMTRELGTWGIGWEEALNVQFPRTEGVRQLQNQQFERLASPSPVTTISPVIIQRVYRFTSRPQQVTAEIAIRPSRNRVTHYTVVDIQPHRTHLATRAMISIQGEPRLSVEFTLPENLQVVELLAPELEDWFITPATGSTPATLTVLFSSPQQKQLEVIIRGHIQQNALNGKPLQVAGLQLQNAEQSSTYLGIGAADMLGLSLTGNAGWNLVDPAQLPAPLKQMASFALRVGLGNQTADVTPVTLNLHRQQAQVRGNSVSVIAVSNSSLDIGLSLQWTVASAATDRFYLTTPGWFAGRLEFQSPEIRQVRSEPAGGDRLLWTIETKTPQSQQLLITAAVSLPVPEDRSIVTPVLQFLNAPAMAETTTGQNLTPLETQNHFVVLVNLGTEPLRPITSHAHQGVTAQELPLTIPQPMVQQAMEILRLSPALTPQWELRRVEQQNFPPATIPLAELTTVIDDSGQWRTRAVYHVKNRQRQFLPVVLPENTRILSILVDSQPARTVKQQLGEANVSLIPLPAAGIADLAIPVELVLEGNLEQHWTSIWLRKRVQIPAPVVLTIKASEEFGIPVQHTTWKLSTPEDLVLKPVSGANTNLNASSQSEVSQFALQTRLAEMLELSQILTQSRLTLDQKLRAKQNLLELKGQIEGEYSGYSSSYEFRPDSPSPHQLNRQTELLDQVEQQLQNFSQSQTELTIITEEQASGRKYIMSNNGLILEQNQQSAPASESRLDFSGSQSDSQSRIRLPVNTPAAPGQKKEESPAGRLMSRSSRNEAEDRSSLMQENQKQNLMYQQQVQPGYPLRTHTIQNNTKVDMSTPVDAFSVVPTPGEKIPGKDKLATAAAPAVSLRAGGLSLPVELPVYGQVQVFSKVGGNPQLEVEVHSRTARFHSLGWLWTIGIALLLVLCGKEMRQGNHQRVTSLLLLLGGLVGFAFLPGFAGGLGLAVTITVVFLLNFSGKNLPQTPKTTSQQQ